MLVVFTSTSDTNLSPELVLVAFGGGFSSVSGTGAVAWSAVSAAFFAALFFFLRYSASWIYQKTRHHYSTTNLNLISHQIITQDLGNENSTFQTERADDGGNLRAFDFSTISKTIDGTTSLTQSGQCSLFNQTCLDKKIQHFQKVKLPTSGNQRLRLSQATDIPASSPRGDPSSARTTTTPHRRRRRTTTPAPTPWLATPPSSLPPTQPPNPIQISARSPPPTPPPPPPGNRRPRCSRRFDRRPPGERGRDLAEEGGRIRNWDLGVDFWGIRAALRNLSRSALHPTQVFGPQFAPASLLLLLLVRAASWRRGRCGVRPVLGFPAVASSRSRVVSSLG